MLGAVAAKENKGKCLQLIIIGVSMLTKPIREPRGPASQVDQVNFHNRRCPAHA